jgi:hypothetical protein
MKTPRIPALRLPTLVCAWCKGMIRAGSPKISHGICRGCAADKFGKVVSAVNPLPPRQSAHGN